MLEATTRVARSGHAAVSPESATNDEVISRKTSLSLTSRVWAVWNNSRPNVVR